MDVQSNKLQGPAQRLTHRKTRNNKICCRDSNFFLCCPCAERPGDNKRASIANTATSNAVDSTACEWKSNTSKHERQGEHASCMDSASSSSSEKKLEEPKTQQSAFGKDPRFRNGDALLPEALEKSCWCTGWTTQTKLCSWVVTVLDITNQS